MKSGNKNNFIAFLQHVFPFTFQLPVRIIDENEDTWTYSAILDEQLRPLRQQMVAEMVYQICDVGRLGTFWKDI